MQAKHLQFSAMIHKRNIDSAFDIPDDLVKNTRNALGEDEGRLEHLEDLFRQWTKVSSHIPKNYDRRVARNYLRGAKFSLETAKRKFEGYFLAKFAHPHLYTDRISGFDPGFDSLHMVCMPKMTQKGERVLVMALKEKEAADFDIFNVVKLILTLMDLLMTSEKPSIGFATIIDCHNFTPSHVPKFLTPIFRNLLAILRQAYAIRLTQVHFINAPSLVDKLITMTRPLLHPKVRNYIYVHKGKKSLLDHISPEVLPADYNGNLGKLKELNEKWREIFNEHSDWFEEQEGVVLVGEPPKRISSFAEENSLVGSFRQLNID